MTSAYEAGRAPEITLRHRLRIARDEAGLDIATLADRMGVSRNTISAAENGKSNPRRLLVNAWALATGVPASWLLTGETPGMPDGPDGGHGVRPEVFETPTFCTAGGGVASAQVVPLKRSDHQPAVEPLRRAS